MTSFYDLCLKSTSREVCDKARKLGWKSTNCNLETVFLNADNWGELKEKIREKRSEADVLVYYGTTEQLNRKAVESSEIDILLTSVNEGKVTGFNHVTAKKASKNGVAVGLDLSETPEDPEKRSVMLADWRKIMELCEKYGADYLVTTGASTVMELRVPQDIAALIDSIGFSGQDSVSRTPRKILETIKGEEA